MPKLLKTEKQYSKESRKSFDDSLIRNLLSKYEQEGFGPKDAKNLAAQEIFLKAVASSEMAEIITLKGGVVIFNLSRNKRRVTKDIDFDFIRYSIDNESIVAFIRKLNSRSLYSFVATGPFVELHHQDYHGKRVNLTIRDPSNRSIHLKLDIGVHAYPELKQETTIFKFDSSEKGIALTINPPSQVAAEKLISLARFGVLSTRYKDIYDLYFLIAEAGVLVPETRNTLKLFAAKATNGPKSIDEIISSIISALTNPSFIKDVQNPSSKWIDVDFDQIINCVLGFVKQLK